MESLTLMAVVNTIAAISSNPLVSKPLEKIGENFGDLIWTQVGKLITKLREKKLVPRLIEAVEANEPQPLDYGQAVLELTEAAKKDPEIAQAVLDVEAAVNNDQSETAKKIQKLAEEIKNQSSVVKNYNFSKLAEEIKIEKGGILAQRGESGKVNSH
jgi:predicted  nucleic acid-binding Zn-ribbon protein